MAAYQGQIPTDQSFLAGTDPIRTTTVTGGGITTYYYRTTAGTRASTTSLSSVPVGAVIERIVTS